jgi:hypothetical protein
MAKASIGHQPPSGVSPSAPPTIPRSMAATTAASGTYRISGCAGTGCGAPGSRPMDASACVCLTGVSS